MQIWGNWSASVGPNAPLDDSCAPQQEGSVKSFVKAWTDAGAQAHQIVVGVPAYGHTFHVASSAISTADALTKYPSFDAGASQGPQLGDSWTNVASTDPCGNVVPAGGDMFWWGMAQQGFLDSSGNALSGIMHAHDTCSQTVRLFVRTIKLILLTLPRFSQDYVYDPNKQVAVSYDSVASFREYHLL